MYLFNVILNLTFTENLCNFYSFWKTIDAPRQNEFPCGSTTIFPSVEFQKRSLERRELNSAQTLAGRQTTLFRTTPRFLRDPKVPPWLTSRAGPKTLKKINKRKRKQNANGDSALMG